MIHFWESYRRPPGQLQRRHQKHLLVLMDVVTAWMVGYLLTGTRQGRPMASVPEAVQWGLLTCLRFTKTEKKKDFIVGWCWITDLTVVVVWSSSYRMILCVVGSSILRRMALVGSYPGTEVCYLVSLIHVKSLHHFWVFDKIIQDPFFGTTPGTLY